VRIILILILLSGCAKDLDLNPLTTVMRELLKMEYDETRVKILENNQEKHTQNSVD
jgi:hypothetical protein|tara:strand:- start:53 stop:220 length:168 start_codon:yes stop_codon:yes gene_type:complete